MLTRRTFLMGSASIISGAALPSLPSKVEETGYVLSFYTKGLLVEGGRTNESILQSDGFSITWSDGKLGGWRRMAKHIGETEAQVYIANDPLHTIPGLFGQVEEGQFATVHIEPALTNYIKTT